MSRTAGVRPGAGRTLWIISLFLTLTETVLGVAVTQTIDGVQVALTDFVLGFPLSVAAAFFMILWIRPWVFYSPGEYGDTDVGRYVDALAQAKFSRATTRTADVPGDTTIVGNPDLNPDGSVSAAEAVAFVPGVRIEDDADGRGRHLRPAEHGQ